MNIKKNSLDGLKEKFNKLDEFRILELEEVFGQRTEYNTPMLPNFIATLETVCNLGPFPTSILQALVKQGIHSPHILVNTFGGGISNLAKQLVYMKLSLFIEEYPTITRRLFAISRTLLGFSFCVENIFPSKWMNAKKTEVFDASFNSMKLDEIIELQSSSIDSQFDTEMMMKVNKIKSAAMEITNPNNNINIFDITSNASQNNNDDDSTINSIKSTPVIIPSTVSLPGEPFQFITGRKF